jgi:hypothetical protein
MLRQAVVKGDRRLADEARGQQFPSWLPCRPVQTHVHRIENWLNHTDPILGGKKLPLAHYEESRSLAVHPNGDRFVLETEWQRAACLRRVRPYLTPPAPTGGATH